jgi:hypothetical protein
MNKKSVLLTALAIAGFAVTSSAQTVPNYVPSNGLVGWWPFNGNAVDESINTNDGTVNGATLIADRFGSNGKAYIFDGVDDYIDINNSTSLANVPDLSISAWVKLTNINTNDAGIVTKWFFSNNIVCNNSSFDSYMMAIFNNSYISSTNVNTMAGNNVSSNLIYFDNVWHHLVFTHDQLIGGKFYIDGSLVATQNTTGAICPSTNNLLFGADNYQGSIYRYLNGALDDIGIWNRALTPSEITGLYNGNICYQTITVTDTLLINTNLTGFNPVTYQNTIKIWPNPTNDHITIDNGNLANLTGHQIKISNALGQQVFQSAITQQQFYVDMSTWGGNGIYFVNLINAQGVTIETRKIVLQ